MPRVLCVGHAVQDFVFTLDELPRKAEKYRATGFATHGGGPAATAAVTISRLGGDALLAARVGDDLGGQLICAELQEEQVDCTLVKAFGGHQSSVSSVLVDNRGERQIVNYLDAGLPVSPDWLPAQLPEDTAVVLGDTRWVEGSTMMLTRARALGLPAVLDADVPVPKDGRLLHSATHVAFSVPGLVDYCNDTDIERALVTVQKETGAWCCVTQGASVVLYTDGGPLRQQAACKVEVRDTLGAGDVWHGAFALALAENKTEARAIVFANSAAAIKVQKFGGRMSIPTRAEVETFISKNKLAEAATGNVE